MPLATTLDGRLNQLTWPALPDVSSLWSSYASTLCLAPMDSGRTKPTSLSLLCRQPVNSCDAPRWPHSLKHSLVFIAFFSVSAQFSKTWHQIQSGSTGVSNVPWNFLFLFSNFSSFTHHLSNNLCPLGKCLVWQQLWVMCPWFFTPGSCICKDKNLLSTHSLSLSLWEETFFITRCLCLISSKGRYFEGHRSIFLLDSAPDKGSLLDPGSQCHI